MNFAGKYSYHVSSSHAGVSITTDLELLQDGLNIRGKISSEGNFYYQSKPEDGFSYELNGVIDPVHPDMVTLSCERGEVKAWFVSDQLYVDFSGGPQAYTHTLVLFDLIS